MGFAFHTKVFFILKGHPAFGVAWLDCQQAWRLEIVLKAIKRRSGLTRVIAKRLQRWEGLGSQLLLFGEPRSGPWQLSPEGVSGCGSPVHEGVGTGQAGGEGAWGAARAFLGLTPGWDGKRWRHATCRTQSVHVTGCRGGQLNQRPGGWGEGGRCRDRGLSLGDCEQIQRQVVKWVTLERRVQSDRGHSICLCLEWEKNAEASESRHPSDPPRPSCPRHSSRCGMRRKLQRNRLKYKGVVACVDCYSAGKQTPPSFLKTPSWANLTRATCLHPKASTAPFVHARTDLAKGRRAELPRSLVMPGKSHSSRNLNAPVGLGETVWGL